ncbi:hypothetical protein Trisim1_007952 [Trichoderma cf. simile WF8]
MAILSIGDLPSEMILSIMEHLPNMATLNDFILSNRSFYNIFNNHPAGIIISVLKNELGEDLFVHAIVAHYVEKMSVKLPCFTELSMDQIDTEAANLRGIRDQAYILQHSGPGYSSIQINLRDAHRISYLWNKISELSTAFLKDCILGLGRLFRPLLASVKRRPVSVDEMRRIRQSMYMFHILSVFCKDLFLDIEVSPNNQIIQHKVDACVDKISKLQRSLVDGFMAPWELCQVVTLQGWFRRQLRELEYDGLLNERLMPYVLSQGIECMHEGICIDTQARYGFGSQLEGGYHFFLNKMKEKARQYPAHGFGMILSRGLRDNWTRKTGMPFDQYSSFASYGDEGAYTAWSRLETPKNRPDMDMSDPESWDLLVNAESMLDVWSAGFWDTDRWPDISHSLDDDLQPDPWRHVMLHWDSFQVGWESALDPKMKEGVAPPEEE